MRVVYIHQYYRNRGMWGGTRSYELGRRLAAHGHEVHIITTEVEAPKLSLRWRVTGDDGLFVHRLPVPYSNYMSYRRRILAFLQFAVCASIESARLKAHVVLATSTPLTVAVPGMIAARMRRVPFVFEVRDLWPELPIEMGALRNPWAKRLAFALVQLTYRNADRVVALSPGMADCIASYGYPENRIAVIPNGCDIDLFTVGTEHVQRFREAHEWLQDRPLVVYAGTFGAINGVDYLVRIAARALRQDPEIRFLLVGDGRDRPKLTQLAHELGVLNQNLFILPPVSKAALPALLGAATLTTSLFLPIPRMWDNSANKFFDALAAGRPIAINYGGWQANLLQDSGAGVVLSADDVPNAAAEMIARVRDSAWLARAADASRLLAIQQFGRDDLFARFEKVLVEAHGAAAGSVGPVRRLRRPV